MYGSEKVSEDSERTAFRKAEKKYKLYYDSTLKKKKQPKQVDLSEVLDFNSILESWKSNALIPPGIVPLQSDSGHPFFCLENRPGFCFIPGGLSIEEQCQWIKESLISFPQPPNRTNHNAFYGPIHDLFVAAKEKKVLVEEVGSSSPPPSGLDSSFSNGDPKAWKLVEEQEVSSRGKGCKPISASVLLRKLRWSTLGLQFEWSKAGDTQLLFFIFFLMIGLRNYDVSLPHNKIPDALCGLAKRLAAPAMPKGEDFKPEAAIVNYFGLGDTLGGHLDDMEKDWSKPIVSMSLGCKAIFLLGGKSREDPPLAMFLRSGDVVLMAGEARECYHGVPRIFTDKENAEILALELQFSKEEDHCFLEYIQTSRININIRQVF
ncbi:Alkylated DNA repair protein AlkB [Trema orientale]|uniref:Alkylated DNA repair protein AlkB n=1 Tax=Trema orientale TaxID=63057 RepID=A0A2P5A7Z2_TREOI|nr:Alkylated DNA repair protein AlkB [Trema orientale]